MTSREVRKKTRTIYVGKVPVGGGNPIVVQSMTKTDTADVKSTIKQIKSLDASGCEIIRLAVPDMNAAKTLGKIKKSIRIPLIADIHFDWRLALEAIKQGVDGLRINPGNIGARWKIKDVVNAAGERGISIRIGVNAGSLEKELLRKYGHPKPEALVESAERHIQILEELKFTNMKVSLKASEVLKTVEAYRLFSERYDYPLHIGISEAGPPSRGIIKSSVGLGILLSEGIGDTIRVSLTAEPEEEVRVAYEILKSLRLRKKGVDIISCPTCGRCRIDLKGLAAKVEYKFRDLDKPITIAVMGCVVNGPGEAREADFGIAGGKGRGIIFKKGKILRTVKEDELLDALLEEIEV
ncbi:MAG: 4-hydroxy-3-methylbut-2-en-1-yl diphosphate synthase [Nitrospirae bacterium CG_4_10_14_0_8_um_filter_41_23]|nr:flavodoxin-dependent (E)-4-hydroxy-3-methylbut-2-enyl-diphosphate synthase [Nitrospirota bacterium]OIP60269.1 MAG: 4-hydroxy-3-methylbut-2-en-1-yl diphosphate synthase [Nitrospirae bacterium CG2_30_41_42]PIQ94483.1 MAG: 4-hydroxy-3-methylbut-2-en-1-yl diphosphate synthase [Nitrospirae bacterium CG11_big_fil_rev_8_21_14_0_20_41_14]PIV44702.1 MAG: 4-hydroxy-3-methylbut-2-en-1-yl diphosphate synthase [Nitrospirae bacterium CG02_land_8_20_14_3_00_41_53]PIW87763.1 MAG: 4-hydroxy-3-methylbut-2-en-